MKKILSLVFLLGAMICSTPQDAYANEKVDKILVWIAVPKEYVGEYNVYLHSDADPTGTRLYPDFNSYYNEDWDLYRVYLKNMPAGNYWVTTSTSKDGSFMDSIGFGYPDTNQKSLVPNIDTNVSMINIKPTNNLSYIDTGEIESIHCNHPAAATDGLAQFFCIFDSAENIGNSLNAIEDIFITLFRDYYDKSRYSHEAATDVLFTYCENSGHFDDFILLYQPYGYSFSEYAYDSENRLLQNMAYHPISNPDGSDSVVREMSAYFSKKPSALEDLFTEEKLSYTFLHQLRDWGWNIVVDTRNLKYDKDGNCISKFIVKEDSDEEKIFLFPDLGDAVPDDLPNVGKANPYLTFTDENNSPDTDAPNQSVDYGEKQFENIPKDEDSLFSGTPNDNVFINGNPEESSPLTGIVAAIIIGIIILGAVIIIVVKTKKN